MAGYGIRANRRAKTVIGGYFRQNPAGKYALSGREMDPGWVVYGRIGSGRPGSGVLGVNQDQPDAGQIP